MTPFVLNGVVIYILQQTVHEQYNFWLTVVQSFNYLSLTLHLGAKLDFDNI